MAGNTLVTFTTFIKALATLQFTGLLNPVAVAATVLIGYEFADFGSGVYHWAMDNYGNAKTPVFGNQIIGFQGHHKHPWTITRRDTANNIAPVCQATFPVIGATLMASNFISPYLSIWAATSVMFINLSQELHKWSHTDPKELKPIVRLLQRLKIILPCSEHFKGI